MPSKRQALSDLKTGKPKPASALAPLESKADANAFSELGSVDPSTLGPNDARAVEAAAREALAELWRIADVPTPAYPCTAADAIALAQGIQYACDAEFVKSLIDKGRMMPPPQMVAGARRWAAVDVLRLLQILEADRRWKPFSSFHDCKKNSLDRILEHQRHAGEIDQMHRDVEHFDLRQLLIQITESESRPMREALRVLVEAKLESQHGIRL